MWIDVVAIGFPNFLTISKTISLSGILIPISFLLESNNLGTSLVAVRINVKGPGNDCFKSLKVGRSICLQ